MTPPGALITVVLLAIIVAGNRRQSALALICGVLYLSLTQQLRFLGLNLYSIRILELAAFLRVMGRHEFSFSSLNRIDRTLLNAYGFATVVYLIRSKDGYGSAIAGALDAVFCYFAFRGFIRSFDEHLAILRHLVILLVPYMILLVIERKIGRIPFPFMAGSAGMEGGFVRDGVPRCFGSFRNMDLLGSFGASLIPLYISMLFLKTERWRASIGVIFGCGMVFLSNSGGPLSAAGVAFVGWGLWRFRRSMRTFRFGILAVTLLLAMVMKAPVWYVIDRVSSVTGGSGWHRAYLIDVAMKHLNQWWLWGMAITDTSDWFPYTIHVTGGADITNQYILFGLTAGLLAIFLLIYLLVTCFSALGKALAAVRSAGVKSSGIEAMLWGLGVMLIVHSVNWLGITYYDQIYVIWFMHLAIISTLTEGVLRRYRSQKTLAPIGSADPSQTKQQPRERTSFPERLSRNRFSLSPCGSWVG